VVQAGRLRGLGGLWREVLLDKLHQLDRLSYCLR